jgi:mono/diheme cytochrome c family protein
MVVKPALLLVGVLIISTPQALQHGCRDTKQSFVSVPYSYYGTRDMRHSVALMPQKGFLRLPDSSSVPVQGREPVFDRESPPGWLVNPVPPERRETSAQRGEIKFQRTCVPCHGKSMLGDGPVAAQFMPPPDLLGEMTRGRSDGFIYSYIRHGGMVMPSYGAQVTAAEAWDLINYIRHMQRTSPR